jgi:hypothetical protein
MLKNRKSLLYLFCSIATIVVASIGLFKRRENQEKKQIEPFLKVLVYQSHFGYTLFGDKPVSIAGYFNQEPIENLFCGQWDRSNLRNLWKIWEKYQKNLTIKEYILLNETDVDVEGIQVISLINKKAFTAKIREHIDLFQSILGNHITPEFLLDGVSLPHASLFRLLKCNEGLYGILLGYGKNNSFAFKRRLELAKLVDPLYRDFPIYFSLNFPQPSSEFSSFSEEYESLQTQLVPFPRKHELSHIVFPYMVVLENDDETVHLEKRYREDRKKIVQTYSKGDFLNITLKQLCR